MAFGDTFSNPAPRCPLQPHFDLRRLWGGERTHLNWQWPEGDSILACKHAMSKANVRRSTKRSLLREAVLQAFLPSSVQKLCCALQRYPASSTNQIAIRGRSPSMVPICCQLNGLSDRKSSSASCRKSICCLVGSIFCLCKRRPKFLCPKRRIRLHWPQNLAFSEHRS